METPDSSFTAFSGAWLGLLGLALLFARLITPHERRLIAATALLLSGVFFLVRWTVQPAFGPVGAVHWLAGIAMFLRAGLAWRPATASRAGPWAVLFLLPPAFVGAVLLGGFLGAALDGLPFHPASG